MAVETPGHRYFASQTSCLSLLVKNYQDGGFKRRKGNDLALDAHLTLEVINDQRQVLQATQETAPLVTASSSSRSDLTVREDLQVVVIGIHTTAPLSGDLAQHAETFQQVNRLACRWRGQADQF